MPWHMVCRYHVPAKGIGVGFHSVSSRCRFASSHSRIIFTPRFETVRCSRIQWACISESIVSDILMLTGCSRFSFTCTFEGRFVVAMDET